MSAQPYSAELPASVDLLIAGGGAAGLSAALAGVGLGLSVLLLDAHDFASSASVQAQGGFSAVTAQGIAAGDSVAGHAADTLDAGAGHGDPAVVARICAAAAAHVATLESWGTAWDRRTDGGYALTREAAHRADRILHCGGDASGAGIVAALRARAGQVVARTTHEATGAGRGRLHMAADARVTGLLEDSGAVVGARVAVGGEPQSVAGGADCGAASARTIRAGAVLLATGGINGIYGKRTSRWANDPTALALAWDAGALFADVEMVQFHPTFAPDADFMISEVLRGEGAVLRDATGARFMPALDPRAELAGRDIVARGVAAAIRDTGGAWLDASPIVASHGTDFLARRFPTITAQLARAGLDLEAAPVRVMPAEHYWMGGIAVDGHTRSSVPGLLVAGEASRTGLHGANRLASNSLLEAVHTGLAAAACVAAGRAGEPGRIRLGYELPVEPAGRLSGGLSGGQPEAGGPVSTAQAPTPAAVTERVRLSADEHLGVSREARGLAAAGRELSGLLAQHPGHPAALMASVIAAGAQARTDSLGTHLRTDAVGPAKPGHTSVAVSRRPGALGLCVPSAGAARVDPGPAFDPARSPYDLAAS
ncbi:FAD-binding protein [Brevibacterium sp. 50QC2O2]|uniref:FAD-binding protein n=1 Tax=Brevibacterium sp. 50QC2O2 TaxID=2968459 RepID=UPI00211CD7E9|nr:FAD-binding protein [Brevibacterium sp. 50QC2O2]MCQ9388657.1 FAD-binding protein [Brevibacterium sp. 50QC2O2]